MAMSNLKILFLVNGTENSADAMRAKAFIQKFPENWKVQCHYRLISKVKSIGIFIQSAFQFQPDIIYVMKMAYTGVLAGIIAQKIIGCKLMIDTGDVYYELAKSTGNYSKLQLKFIYWAEQIALKLSDSIIVRGRYHKILLENQQFSPVDFVPDGVEMSCLEPVNASHLRHKLGLEDSLVVGLIGTMDWSQRHKICYGWDIIEALGLLKDLPIKALLIGDGEGRVILENRAKELDVFNNVIFTGYISYHHLPLYLSAIDVCVSTQSNDLVGMVRTTGKLPLYLAYNKYVIATDVGEAHYLLSQIGCLLSYEGVCDRLHPIRLAQQIRKLWANPDLLKTAEQGQAIAKANFDYDILAQRIQKICENLVNH